MFLLQFFPPVKHVFHCDISVLGTFQLILEHILRRMLSWRPMNYNFCKLDNCYFYLFCLNTHWGVSWYEFWNVLMWEDLLLFHRYLNTTHLLCNCDLSWLPRWIEKKEEDTEGFKSNIHAVCLHPKPVERRSIFNLSSSEFVCGKDFNSMGLLFQQPSWF